MRTVGDFKKAGGQFHALDVVGHDTEAHRTRRHVEIHDAKYHNGVVLYDHYSIKSFAWRTNTGVKPDFVGDIEYEVIGGEVYVNICGSVSFCYAGIGGDFQVVKCRPRLPAQDVTHFVDITSPVEQPSTATLQFSQSEIAWAFGELKLVCPDEEFKVAASLINAINTKRSRDAKHNDMIDEMQNHCKALTYSDAEQLIKAGYVK